MFTHVTTKHLLSFQFTTYVTAHQRAEMYKARNATICYNDYDLRKVTFDTVKNNQTSAPSALAVHIAEEKAKQKNSTTEIGNGFTDSPVEPDSHPRKLTTPQFKSNGTLPLIIISEVTEILLSCNWNY